MVNSKITRLVAGLGLMYLVGCQEEPIIESLPLKLAIDNTNYTLLVGQTTHDQLKLLTEIFIDKTDDHATGFTYNSIERKLTPVCIPDSTLNKTLKEIDEDKNNVLDSEELLHYYFAN